MIATVTMPRKRTERLLPVRSTVPEADGTLARRDTHYRLSELGPVSSHGGEWLWSSPTPVAAIAPRAPWLIWVLGPVAGDVMVDGSSRGERLRPLGLLWSAARGRVSQKLRELAGRLVCIFELVGLAEAIGDRESADGLERPRPELCQRVE